MSTPLLLYIASVLGAIALVLMMPRPGNRLAPLGALLGAATLGGCWLAVAFNTGLIHDFSANTLGLPATTFIYFYIFSAIAIAAAVRVITHRRPVYSALWFIMVVLAGAGMFLVLSADFMAFAMIIIYGGAILVTYMFVIMLASQPLEPGQEDQAPAYDRFGRDPLWACVAGFLLLAVLLTVSFDNPDRPTMLANPDAKMASDAEVLRDTLTGRGLDAENSDELASSPQFTADRVSNVERVGLDLFNKHPLAIELAGVILLVSLIGAVVIAKTHIPPGEQHPDPESAAAKAAQTQGGAA
ncbi:MAG: NADH-quinone oxidoreductase subunit J [Planctomycetota bacterium]